MPDCKSIQRCQIVCFIPTLDQKRVFMPVFQLFNIELIVRRHFVVRDDCIWKEKSPGRFESVCCSHY